jgi:hypothetical protein
MIEVPSVGQTDQKPQGLRRCAKALFVPWNLMERVGMRREYHAVRESLHRSGQWFDTVGYVILRDEWVAT